MSVSANGNHSWGSADTTMFLVAGLLDCVDGDIVAYVKELSMVNVCDAL